MAVHGLAASIRAAKENEVFDLGGQSAATIQATVQAAFAEPLEGSHHGGDNGMIRITLVTGAGKQSRQKYDDNAHKAVVTALQQVGYQEDRTASGVMECAGLYKLQHDTGKNLKTVVIYPRIVVRLQQNTSKEKKAQHSDDDDEEEALIPEDTPGYKLAVASMPTFANILKTKCASWSQKKACLECLEALQDIVKTLDEKLMHGQPLTEPEQSFYNVVSQLDEKIATVKHESKQHVQEGQLTEYERNLLLEHNAQRLAAEEGNSKNAKKLLERKKLLQSIQPILPRPLKHHAAIARLYKEASNLMHLNENQLLTVKERQMVSRREQIWQEIDDLQQASREWFEDDAVFAVRLQASQQEMAKFQAAAASKSSSGRGGTTSSSAANAKLKAPPKGSKWVVPTSQKGSKKKTGGKPSGSDVFGAMRRKQGNDDDDSSTSSSDDNDDDDEEEETNTTIQTTASGTTTDKPSEKTIGGQKTTTKPSQSKKSKKKKKKNTTKSENALLESVSRSVAAQREEDAEAQTALGKILWFCNTYIFSLIATIIVWLFGLAFGKPKKKTKKN